MNKQWELILSDDPPTVAKLEAELGITQVQAVDDYIEHSCWSEDLPDFLGGKGSAEQRRAALRAAWLKEAPDQKFDWSRLTPLERELHGVLVHLAAFVDDEEAKAVLREAMDLINAKAQKPLS